MNRFHELPPASLRASPSSEAIWWSGESWPYKSTLKSRHVGFMLLMRSILRRWGPAFNCFSRAIAASAVSAISALSPPPAARPPAAPPDCHAPIASGLTTTKKRGHRIQKPELSSSNSGYWPTTFESPPDTLDGLYHGQGSMNFLRRHCERVFRAKQSGGVVSPSPTSQRSNLGKLGSCS